MDLEGQYGRRTRSDAGYAMAALLAVIAIWGVLWLMAVPVWKQTVQREKEAELIWRAGQYARAVALYQRKYANAFPPNLDVLLREKYLRKKYKDPITKGDFRLLSPVELQTMPGMTTATPGIAGRTGPGGAGQPRLPGGNTSFTPANQPDGAGTGTPGGPSMGSGLSPRPGGFSQPTGLGPNAGPTGGIAAAVSRSTAQSIKVFKNRRQYNQWIVTVQDVMPRGGVGIQPGQQPGQPPGTSTPGLSPSPGLSPGTSPGSTPGFPSRRP